MPIRHPTRPNIYQCYHFNNENHAQMLISAILGVVTLATIEDDKMYSLTH